MIEVKSKRDLEGYRVERAYKALVEAEDNAKLLHWTLAANRLYYALFYMSSALLLDKGIGVKSHAGVIAKIGQNFVQPGLLSREDAKLISALQNMRHQGDYDDFNDWTEADVSPMFEPTKKLLDKMKALITLV